MVSCDASKQNVSDFVTVRSPLITLLCYVFVIGCTFIGYGSTIKEDNLLKDPDVKINWNSIFEKLNSKEYCLHSRTTNIEHDASKLEQNYHAVSLTSAVQYKPAPKYWENGDYHNDSSAYGTDFVFLLNSTDVGILPVDQAMADQTTKEEHIRKISEYIIVAVSLHHTYSSKGKCHNETVSAENKYAPDLTETVTKCEPDTENWACYTFYFPNKIYNHTVDLKNAPIPHSKTTEEDDMETCMKNTYTCSAPTDLSALKKARAQRIEDNAPCASKLYIQTTHQPDPKLIKMLSKATRIMIQQRLFWSGMVLLGIVAAFTVWASFRGSTNAIKDFMSARVRAEVDSRESTRLIH